MGGISRLSINRDTNATEIITASKNQWQSKSKCYMRQCTMFVSFVFMPWLNFP